MKVKRDSKPNPGFLKEWPSEPLPSLYRDLIVGVLILIILAGLTFGLIYSLNLPLSSDTVVPGLVAMEVFQHGNLQYDFPSNDPYLFTDTYTFYLIPQLISDYNPTVLNLTAYFIFLLVIVIFSYIVYRYSGKINALIFAALLVSVGPVAYFQFITPVNHIGSLFFTGVLLLLFEFPRFSNSSLPYKAACMVLSCLMVISDSVIMVTFVVPYILTYVFIFRKKYNRLDPAMGIFLLITAVTLFVKYKLIHSFWSMPSQAVKSSEMIPTNISIFFNGVVQLFDQYLNNFTGVAIIGGIAVLAIIIIFIYYAAMHLDKKALYLYSIFGLSFVFITIGMIFTSLGGGSALRFLTFALVSFMVIISLAFRYTNKNKTACIAFLVLVIILAASTLPLNIANINSIDHTPNAREYNMLGYMRSNNITTAASGYWNSNILTYLSKEDIMVLTMAPKEDTLMANPWLGTWRWWSTLGGVQPDPFYVILDGRDSTMNQSLQVFRNYPPVSVQHFENYTIYRMT